MAVQEGGKSFERRTPKAEAPPPPPETSEEERRANASREDIPEEERFRRVKLFRENIEHFTREWQEGLKRPERQDLRWVMGVQATATGFMELVKRMKFYRRKEEASEREWGAMLDLLQALTLDEEALVERGELVHRPLVSGPASPYQPVEDLSE